MTNSLRIDRNRQVVSNRVVDSQTLCPKAWSLSWSYCEILTLCPQKNSHCRVQFQIATSRLFAPLHGDAPTALPSHRLATDFRHVTNFRVRCHLTDIEVSKAVAAQRVQTSIEEAQVRLPPAPRAAHHSHRLGRVGLAPAPIGIECEGT